LSLKRDILVSNFCFQMLPNLYPLRHGYTLKQALLMVGMYELQPSWYPTLETAWVHQPLEPIK
jgi:hypothetical protein